MKTRSRVWFYSICVIASAQIIYSAQIARRLNADDVISDGNENYLSQNNGNQGFDDDAENGGNEELNGDDGDGGGNYETNGDDGNDELNDDDENYELNDDYGNDELNDDDGNDEPIGNDGNDELNDNYGNNGPIGNDDNNDPTEDYDNNNLNNDNGIKKTNSYKYKDEDSIAGFKLTPPEIEKFRIWQSGVIPYYIDPQSYDKVLRDKIRLYLSAINAQTGLRFNELPSVPADDAQRFVMFVNRRSQRACQPFTVNDFTNAGMQAVRIGYDCLGNAANTAAAVLALAGVPPMHTAPDRDCYVNVNSENINPEKTDLFKKQSDTDWLFHDLPYDHCSAGHFALNQYSVNGKGSMTLVPERSSTCPVGEAKNLSEVDAKKIKLLYNFLKKGNQIHKAQSDCLKLFNKGPNFGANAAGAGEEPLYDLKPDRYLGKDNSPINCDELDETKPEGNEVNSNEDDPNIADYEDLYEDKDQVDEKGNQEDEDGDQEETEKMDDENITAEGEGGEGSKGGEGEEGGEEEEPEKYINSPQNDSDDVENPSADPDH